MRADVNTDGNRGAAHARIADREGEERCGLSPSAPTAQVGGLSLSVPAEWVDAITAAVAARLELSGASPWMDRPAAAAYLGVALSRLEKDRTVPCHRWEGRVLYHRAELDEWLLGMGAS